MTGVERDFTELFAKIERDRGFRGPLYRPRCLRRRIGVRMRARGVDTPKAYAALLDRDPGEYDRLLRVLTINVSRFFRNPETWEVIRTRLLPDLLGRRGRRVTAWSAGAANGEEAYSLAILIWEWLWDAGRRWHGIRVIGTDIDAESLDLARRACYEPIALTETPPEVRRRWFTGTGPYRLKEPIRSRVDFRQLDLLTEPPGFRADLILCRNLLIYLDREAQGRVFDTFREVLRPGGYLVLGRVETLEAGARDHFEVVDARERVYRRRDGGDRARG